MTAGPLGAVDPAVDPILADPSAEHMDTSAEAIGAMMAVGAAALRVPDVEGDASAPSDHDLLLLSLTHDLKSPLGGLLLALDQLHAGVAGPLTATQERLIARARSAAQGMAILVGSTGDVAAEGRTLAAVDRVFSLRDVLEDVRATTRPLFEDRRLYLRVSVDSTDARRGNPLVFHRVLLNLVVNALKFTEVGGVTITVSEDDPGSIVTRVVDSGVGLSARPARHLDPGLAGERMLPGMRSGIGLDICTRLLHRVGGSLALTSGEGQGTTATFRLPLGRAP